ncbi:hypothetical protein HG536_0H00770 [Torulaspora globosa]|uniref:RRM domain-containing protein n=1 Tax=Torulaspora globosa TaxID=48254 RepID=A0A7G3ZMG6_9SACH|nr:uncharacterized protein HG536_0H00770 [Torulaspora globosa]QLL34702.1 hypothetical protein HG536_0H00770 [Torulaspora globosa]
MKRLFEGGDLPRSKKNGAKTGTRREVTTVLVRNLPKSYNQAKVRKYFLDCGEIREVSVSDSLDKSSRLARIQFGRHDEAITALTKTYKRIGQSEITVSLLENCTIWVTNFPPFYTARNVKELVQSVNVVVLSVRLPSLRYDSNRRFAYVDVSSTTEVVTAVEELNGRVIERYRLVVKKSNPLEKAQRTDYGAAERREVMVRQLSKQQLTEQYLRQHFSECGPVESVVVPANQIESSEGYAFITFQDQSAAKAAVQVEKLDGKQVQVILADKKAFIERQKVKRIMTSRLTDDRIIALYPLSDKTSKSQIEALLLDKVIATRDAINEILLVTDRQAAFVSFKEPQVAAKCIISLNGVEFQRQILHCGTVSDLRHPKVDKTQNRPSLGNETPSPKPALEDREDGQKLSNNDFRKMFLGK